MFAIRQEWCGSSLVSAEGPCANFTPLDGGAGSRAEAEIIMNAIEQEAASAGPLPLPDAASTGHQINSPRWLKPCVAAAHDRGELGADHVNNVDRRFVTWLPQLFLQQG